MAQSFRYQRGLSYLPVGAIALSILLSLGAHNARAQQSTRYDEFELHHSIVYTTFVAPEVAAEYGITRGADKAMLTLSVRNAASGDMAGRPIDDEITRDTAERIARVRASDEAQEGIASFFEKRKPAWVQQTQTG
mgnify:CR=1 FL=1